MNRRITTAIAATALAALAFGATACSTPAEAEDKPGAAQQTKTDLVGELNAYAKANTSAEEAKAVTEHVTGVKGIETVKRTSVVTVTTDFVSYKFGEPEVDDLPTDEYNKIVDASNKQQAPIALVEGVVTEWLNKEHKAKPGTVTLVDSEGTTVSTGFLGIDED
jgi:hypothetical protein